MLEIGKARIRPEECQQGINPLPRPRHGAVNAFLGQQQRPFDLLGNTEIEQARLHCPIVRQLGELVERSNNKIWHDDYLLMPNCLSLRYRWVRSRPTTSATLLMLPPVFAM